MWTSADFSCTLNLGFNVTPLHAGPITLSKGRGRVVGGSESTQANAVGNTATSTQSAPVKQHQALSASQFVKGHSRLYECVQTHRRCFLSVEEIPNYSRVRQYPIFPAGDTKLYRAQDDLAPKVPEPSGLHFTPAWSHITVIVTGLFFLPPLCCVGPTHQR